jgi:hypothetical protein
MSQLDHQVAGVPKSTSADDRLCGPLRVLGELHLLRAKARLNGRCVG